MASYAAAAPLPESSRKILSADTAYKMAVVGVASAVGVQLLYGGRATVNLGGNAVNLRMAAAAVGAASVPVTDLVHEWVLPHISHDARMQNTESMILNPVTNGLAMIGLVYAGSMGQTLRGEDMTKLFATGAASEIAGQWMYEMVFKKQY